MSQKSSFGNTSERPAWRPGVPHNDLPLIPPPIDLETRPVLKRCIGARVALAELKQAASLLPNPTIFINTLPLLEAQASSEIEHIVTTTDSLCGTPGRHAGRSEVLPKLDFCDMS